MTYTRIKIDMGDAVTKSLLNGDYCTLELVNLFCHGRAVSNVFNETESAPRGVNKRSAVGFLSLLEHHKPGASTSAKQPKHQVGRLTHVRVVKNSLM